MRPRLPVLPLPVPIMPMTASSQPPVNSPLLPGMRPPILPHPGAGAPGSQEVCVSFFTIC